MDLTQQKLSKSEWDFLEVPTNISEKKILTMIYNGYEDTKYTNNEANSLLAWMKIGTDEDAFHYYIYENNFDKIIKKIIKKYELSFKIKKNKSSDKSLKKQDLIRIKNSSKKIEDIKQNIYEFILLNNAKIFFKKKLCPMRYYTLTQLIKNNVTYINHYVLQFVYWIIETYKNEISKTGLIKNAFEFIEKNTEVFKYTDMKLYEHQAKLFDSLKREGSKMILYQAPTGTGKTMSPVGVAKGKKVIFTCAAKHIGLQLAKACISMGIKIAVAFGCKDSGDIRLHYFAAKDYVKNRRTGAIFRVDNSNGEKVELIITDIQSYLPAMNYMLAFNEPQDIVWYWDEPTITLDYDDHEFHEILQRNWQQNDIPNVVLSSATLPNMDEILPMTRNFQNKFETNNVQEIISYECKKSIPILDANGNIVMPHYIYKDFKKLRKCARHIEKNKTILRHIDVEDMVRFIYYINKKKFITDEYQINNYFEDVSEITIINLKIYYLRILLLIKDNYDTIYKKFQENRARMYNSVIKITTSDAYSLTDGPTIFLTEDVERMGRFYLRASNIPESELDNIMKVMSRNERYMIDLEKVEKDERHRRDKMGTEDLGKDKSKTKDSSDYKAQQAYTKKVVELKAKIHSIELSQKFIPNSQAHIREWSQDKDTSTSFKSDIEDSIVERIMYLNVNKEWKILLLMGIGVFKTHPDKEYMDIMKELAEKQKLYLIIASSDYIYGTNYQFCHGYLSNDLMNMTQEKMIQAFGRVGRNSSQKNYTLRIRNDDLIIKLFTKDDNKPEVRNMNRLFS
uniref:Helicase ATP-binding domain-containing protein n=1 Tax=viral metagenome TaxID=1070528 RepID=A0A6C0J960_9ZZZZ